MESLPTVNGYPNAADLFLNEGGMTWSAAIHHGKQFLVRSLETGARLQELRNQLGDELEAWVDTQTSMCCTDAATYIHFSERFGHLKEQLTQAVTAKPSLVFELLGNFSDIYFEHAMPERAASKPQKAADTTDVLEKKKSAGSVDDDASPAPQISDSPQLELTDEVSQLLLDHSVELFMQVSMGDVSVEKATSIARNTTAPE